MTRHIHPAETASPAPGGWAVRSECSCGVAFASRGATVLEAKRVMRGKVRDHRGFVAAAGPGWTGVAA
jgi:hypothetical protein